MKIDSESLREYRKAAGLNQRELADKSGTSLAMVTVLDSGKRQTASEKIISALAIVLHVNMKDLLLVSDDDVSPFEFLDDKTRKHLYEQGYNPNTWEPSAAKSRPTDLSKDEDNIDVINHMLAATGYSVVRESSNIDDGFVVIRNSKSSYRISLSVLNQFVSSLSDYASYTLNRMILTDGKALAPALILSDDEKL